MKLVVVTKYEHSDQQPKEEVYEWIKTLCEKHDVWFGPQSSNSLNALRKHGIEFSNKVGPLRRVAEDASALIAIGGDGTMLGAAREVAGMDIGLIGINQGHVGFITDIPLDQHTTTLVDRMLDGEHTVEPRMLLEVAGQNALNDVIIQRSDSKMIEYEVFIDELFAYRVRADGLLLSTPTGSTAYNLAAGGAIVMPGADIVNITPLLPQSMSARPLMISGQSRVCVHIVSGEVSVHADGITVASLRRGDHINVQASNKKALFWHHREAYDYLATLRNKLGWQYRAVD